jgi:hypothetical protein
LCSKGSGRQGAESVSRGGSGRGRARRRECHCRRARRRRTNRPLRADAHTRGRRPSVARHRLERSPGLELSLSLSLAISTACSPGEAETSERPVCKTPILSKERGGARGGTAGRHRTRPRDRMSLNLPRARAGCPGLTLPGRTTRSTTTTSEKGRSSCRHKVCLCLSMSSSGAATALSARALSSSGFGPGRPKAPGIAS